MVNYILHIENALLKFKHDTRINPWHISLYISLFQIWNSVRFKDEINIRREELMSLSKIGSANTYTKCLKQLNDWNYIKYTPSKSRFISSKVHMYRFDTTPDTSCDNTPDTSPDNTSVHLVRPFLNNTKHIVNYNKQYKTKEGEEKKSSPHPSQNKNNESSRKGELNSPKKASKDELHSSESSQSKKSSKGDLQSPTKKKKKFTPPELEEVNSFFKEKKSSSVDAERFFNHFESNGWKVGGKAKMKNWKAAARNWIMRSESFKNSNKNQNRLNTNNNKDYNIPL